jgi:hypothetical protein
MIARGGKHSTLVTIARDAQHTAQYVPGTRTQVVIARGVTLVPGAHETNNDALTNEGRLKKRLFFQRKLFTPGKWLMLRCESIKPDVVYLTMFSDLRSDFGASRNSSKRGLTFLCLFVISLRIKTIRYFRLLHSIPHPILRRFDA